jgi:hypothetical protein
MPELTPIIVIFGVFASATVGFFARSIFVPGEIRKAIDQTYRKIENLHRAQPIKDPRNDTRAF